MILSAIQLVALDESAVNFICSHLDKERQKTINAYVNHEDACRALIGDLLSRTLLCEKLGIGLRELEINKTAYGKPYIKNANCHFNLSHSGRWIVCGVDESPLGMDIEEMKPIDLTIARNFFAKKETADLYHLPIEKREEYFYELWVLKESYIKAVGLGLSVPLDSFSVKINSLKQVFFEGPADQNPRFKLFDSFTNYKMAVCSYGAFIPEEITFLSWDHVFKKFQLLLNEDK